MGSSTSYRLLGLFEKVYGNKFEKHFQPLLVGKVVEGYTDTYIDHYISTDLVIDGDNWLIHHRWSTEEESYEGKEIIEEDGMTLKEICQEIYMNKKIETIKVGTGECNDEIYLICELEGNGYFEIPLGFNPDDPDFFNFCEEILSEEERDIFPILCDLTNEISYYEYSNYKTLEKQKELYGKILKILGEEEKQFDLSDFYKMDKLYKVYDQERIDALELLQKIEEIVYS